MSRIEPFDPLNNPIRDIYEHGYLLRRYVDDHQLEATAKAIWENLNDSSDVRRAVLRHLCDQVIDDNAEPPLKPKRFVELRARGLLDAYGDSDTFADTVAAENWEGIEWRELQRYLALYAESQGEDGPYFSSRVFFLHYLEAHNQPLPG